MNKQIIIAVLASMCLLSGCEKNTYQSNTITPYEYSDFRLICDNKTGIVYIDNKITIPRQNGFDKEYHIYTAYYSKDGQLCRYEDDRMVEIREESEEEDEDRN